MHVLRTHALHARGSEPESSEDVNRNRVASVDVIETGRESIERKVRSETRLGFGQERHVSNVAERSGLDQRSIARQALGSLALVGQLVEVPVDGFEASVDEVRVREFAGPFKEFAPLRCALAPAAISTCRRGVYRAEKALLATGAAAASFAELRMEIGARYPPPAATPGAPSGTFSSWFLLRAEMDSASLTT